MQWPSNSPDMNIIESVWGHITTKLRENPPLTVRDLRRRVYTIWNAITPNFIHSLYAQMPTRIQTLVNKLGYPTKY